MTEQDRLEAIEHRDALMDVRAVLATKSGKRFIKYLFKNLDVGELPELGMDGTLLSDRIGFLRAGNSIFKLITESSTEAAGAILAEVEKERQDAIYRETTGDTEA